MPTDKETVHVLFTEEEQGRLGALLLYLQGLPRSHPLRLSPRLTLNAWTHDVMMAHVIAVEQGLAAAAVAPTSGTVERPMTAKTSPARKTTKTRPTAKAPPEERRRGRPPSEAPTKKPHTTYLTTSSEEWIEGHVPRSISTSKFISAAVDHFVRSGAATKFLAGKL